MKNRYFNEKILPVLLRIRSWRLACPGIADYHCLASPRHRRWMLTHRHAHPYTEALIALRGTAVYGMDNRIYPCRPGFVFVFDPGVAHDLGYPSWTPSITHLWISFMQDKAMARLIVGRHGRIHAKGNIPILRNLNNYALWREGVSAACPPDRPPGLIRLRLMTALAEVVAMFVEEGYRDTADDPRHRFQLEKIEAICRHIRETGGVDAHLDHLAQIAGYSKFHFLRLFRQYTGQSVHEYVNQSRLRKIEALLARGLAHKTIAAELGFSCPAAFSRWRRPFRKNA